MWTRGGPLSGWMSGCAATIDCLLQVAKNIKRNVQWSRTKLCFQRNVWQTKQQREEDRGRKSEREWHVKPEQMRGQCYRGVCTSELLDAQEPALFGHSLGLERKTAPQQFRLKLQTHSWTSFMAVPCVSLEFDQKGEMWINIFTWKHFNIYNVWLEDGVSCTMIYTTPAVQSGRCWRVIAIYYTRRYSVVTFLLLTTMSSISLLPFYNWDKHYSCPVPPSMWTNEACRHTVQVASY